MKQMLISVKNTAKAGNIFIFGATRKALRELADNESFSENMIMNIKIKKVSKISEKSGEYVYAITITRKKKRVDTNAMDVGVVNHNKYEALKEDDNEESNESELDF